MILQCKSKSRITYFNFNKRTNQQDSYFRLNLAKRSLIAMKAAVIKYFFAFVKLINFENKHFMPRSSEITKVSFNLLFSFLP